MIEEYGSSIINNPKNSEPVRKISKNLFTGLLQRFRGMTERINEKLAKVFSDPAKQEEIKKPVKESVIARLNTKKQTIADENEHRQRTKTQGREM
ncbi:MAG: hypothetical protein K6F64_09015 [Clostridia bacterium]|nr:hypothetical protein [Clostridia bacterium]